MQAALTCANAHRWLDTEECTDATGDCRYQGKVGCIEVHELIYVSDKLCYSLLPLSVIQAKVVKA